MAVAVTLWQRKLHQRFPVFFTYILAQVAIFAVTFPVWRAGNYEWFFWSYWLGAVVSAILGFKVIHEVFLDVFRPYHTLKDLGTVVFRWAGVVMLMVSAVVALSNSSDHSWLAHGVITLQRSVRLVQTGLILFLLLFSRYLGVSRRQQSFGIALGFGLFASVELVILALASGGFLRESGLGVVNMMTYNLAILTWLGYSLASKVVRETAANHLQTQRWEQGLADLQHPAPSHSLIPMFEGMVERAFSRSSNLGDPAEVGEPFPPQAETTRRRISAAAGTGGSGSHR
ncbi:MAG: hypothetical protein ACHP78_19650 [Terriglobales bacterium]